MSRHNGGTFPRQVYTSATTKDTLTYAGILSRNIIGSVPRGSPQGSGFREAVQGTGMFRETKSIRKLYCVLKR